MQSKKIATFNEIKKVVIESRAEYVDLKKLSSLKDALRNNQILELAIGVESSNEYIRNRIIKKNLSWHDLERVVQLCSVTEVAFQSYLLIKPQTLNERDAIEDAVQSAHDVTLLANNYNVPLRIAFEPVFVIDGTELGRAYQAREYTLINLWSVIEIIKRTHHLATVFVGLSDENLSDGKKPASCPVCSNKLRTLIDEFNGQQEIGIFDSFSCVCKESWKELIHI